MDERIQIQMRIIPNSEGAKECWCWYGKVLSLAIFKDWQELIYGNVRNSHWAGEALGIKRTGPAAKRPYFQVVEEPMATWILESLQKSLVNEGHINIVQMILNRKPSVEEIERVLSS